MRLRRAAAAIAGLLLVAGPAAAQKISIGLGLGLSFVGGGAGAIDGFGAPATAGYSFRLLRQAYLGTGAAVRLRRASDNAESDIGFSGSNDFDTATATTFCAATTCFVVTMYDQSGNARHATNSGFPAQQPTFVFNCIGAKPCAQSTSATRLPTASFTPVVPVTENVVANRSAPADLFWIVFQNNFLYTTLANANQWRIGPGGGVVTPAATDGAWHSGTGIHNGASSVFGIDGVETTGFTSGDATAGTIVLLQGAAGVTAKMTEGIVWSGYALTATERANLTASQRAYFGF